MAPSATPQAPLNPIAAPVQDMRQRNGENLVHLPRLGRGHEIGGHAGKNGGNGKPGHRFMRRQATPDFNQCFRQADLLARLTQGGGLKAGIGRVQLTARKGDLARMMFQMRGTFGQDQTIAPNSHQHRRRAKHPVRRQLVENAQPVEYDQPLIVIE